MSGEEKKVEIPEGWEISLNQPIADFPAEAMKMLGALVPVWKQIGDEKMLNLLGSVHDLMQRIYSAAPEGTKRIQFEVNFRRRNAALEDTGHGGGMSLSVNYYQ